MTIRIGLYVGEESIACVALTGNAIAWHATSGRARGGVVQDEIAALLSLAPVSRFRRASVVVALGPAIAALKILRGLPPIASPRVLHQLIEGMPTRFFSTADVDIALAEPQRCDEGWWVSAAKRPVIEAVAGACAASGVRLRTIHPLPMLLHNALDGSESTQSVQWRDGSVHCDISLSAGAVRAVARRPASGEELAPIAKLVQPLAEATVEREIVAAYAAARAGRSKSLRFEAGPRGKATTAHLILRAASCASLLLGAATMLAAPAIAARRSTERNEHAMSGLRSRASEVAKDRYVAEQQTTALRQVRTFATSRRLMTPLLSSLSMQLPESTAVVMLRLDTLGGALITLSPIGATVVQSVGDTPGIDALQLSAPITREVVGALELQRVAVRFRHKRADPPPKARKS